MPRTGLKRLQKIDFQMTTAEEIKERLDITEVLAGYIKLQKAGKNFRALCPFHNEKTPSFMVSQERQNWHCFGCGEGGDIFDFVMKIEGLEFVEALRLLAQRAGVVLRQQEKQAPSHRGELLEICELATRFFAKQLQAGGNGQKAQEYLRSRGLKEKTILEWRLGFAPESWDGLTTFLLKKNHSQKNIVEAGLAIEKDGGRGIYDRFRSRIIFPLFDGHGAVVGFAGRIFGAKDDKQGKYINTPQTEIYDKSKMLYGLHNAKTAIRKNDRCVLVEGNMDVIASQQEGFSETVATSGTALTPQQLKIIRRYTNNLVFAFDSDAAGFSATKKAVSLAFAEDFAVNIVPLGNSKDPADIVKDNPEAWSKKIKQARPFMDFLLERSQKDNDITTAQGKRRLTTEVLPFVKKMSNAIERAHWLAKLAGILGVNEKFLHEALSKVVKESDNSRLAVDRQTQNETRTREDRIQESLASYILIQKKADQFAPAINKYFGEPIKSVLKGFVAAGQDEKKFFAGLKDEAERKLAQRLCFSGEEIAIDQKEAEACLLELKKLNLKKEIGVLSEEIKSQEGTSINREKLVKLQNLLEELNNLENND